jgi:type I restriction enzyme R subunit
MADLFEPPLSVLDAANLGIELFGESGLKNVIDDLNQSVFPSRAA